MEEQAEDRDANDSSVVRRMSARTPSQTVELNNAIQKWHIEETRLGIPTLFHEEGLHGFQGRYATSFPQSIALAASFDPEMAEDIFTIVAREIRVRGAHHVLSPVVDIAVDPRWGRIEETYGEDPYLVSRMGVAAVKGFQGDGFPIGDDRVLSTLKHMTGHGQPEAGMNVGPSQISDMPIHGFLMMCCAANGALTALLSPIISPLMSCKPATALSMILVMRGLYHSCQG